MEKICKCSRINYSFFPDNFFIFSLCGLKSILNTSLIICAFDAMIRLIG